MEPAHWTEDLSVGEPTLDEHHKHLFALFNRLSDAAGKAEIVAEVLSELLSYIEYHFREEEAVMAQTSYPFIDIHRASHRIMAAHVRDMAGRRLAEPDKCFVEELATYLSGWLVHHIEIEDFEYMPFLALANRSTP
jgi:hemerythrin